MLHPVRPSARPSVCPSVLLCLRFTGNRKTVGTSNLVAMTLDTSNKGEQFCNRKVKGQGHSKQKRKKNLFRACLV